MSFDIPGYFLDLKTKKYFKITPHGPYSLPELRKRLQREQEEEKLAAISAAAAFAKGSQKQPKPTTFSQFLRQRATLGRIECTDTGLRFLLACLKTRSKVSLHGPSSIYNNMLVALTADMSDYGHVFVSNRCSLQHFGYQLDPHFAVWKVGQELMDNSEAQSLHFGSRLFDMNGFTCRSVVGTRGGTFWLRPFPVLPPLLGEEIRSMFTENGSIRQRHHDQIYECPASYGGHSFAVGYQEFSQRKDLFWCSSIDDQHDTVIVGGDRKIYQLSATTLRLKRSRKLISSVFASYIPKSQPALSWFGSRDGKVRLEDWRQPTKDTVINEFVQSSSVYQIQSLDNVRSGHELVTVAMDGSIDVWDTRQSTKKRKSRHKRPLYSLRGHVNESSRHLGFDIDTENQLLMACGSDERVRIWSLDHQNSTSDPLWTSEKFQAPIPAAKFMTTPSKYPKLQDGWSEFLPNSLNSRQRPGILLFGTSKESSQMRSIEWLTPVE
ncbi:hypothetical protein [Parasitella parasitica]|uniref:Uncharacterized protein n=1 Tax=Parasitella parasitica TaxID=35722 RepID=A0A0B7MZN5_9FUNG|nr:hypothetical protein [Parasitella parasitica]